MEGRNLSAMGRGIIANSLLLSRLWHVISVHTPTKAWTRGVQSSIRKFTVPFFPAPSWNHLCQRRHQGGLGLVDIRSQSTAFKLGMIKRMCEDKKSFMVDFLKDLFCYATKSVYPLAAFANPDLYLSQRSKYFTQLPSLRALVESMKVLPKLHWRIDEVALTPIGTILATHLPLWITAPNRPEPHPPNWRMDQVFKVVWTDMEKTTGHLDFIPSGERSIGHRSHPQLERNTRSGFFTPHLSLQSALMNGQGHLSVKDDLAKRINKIKVSKKKNRNTFEEARTREFRLAAFKAYAPTPRADRQNQPGRNLDRHFWKYFWVNTMPHNARNVWWRLLINKLPSRSRLHAILPTIFEPRCQICKDEDETDSHLLFSCPKKLEVWQGTLTKYIKDQEWTAELIESLFYPNTLNLKPLDRIPLVLLISTILATIWKYHFNSIREEVPFDTRQVSAAIDIAINLVKAQLEEERKREEKKNPTAPETTPGTTDNNFPT